MGLGSFFSLLLLLKQSSFSLWMTTGLDVSSIERTRDRVNHRNVGWITSRGGGGGNGEGEDEMKLEGGKGGEIHNCRLRILRDPKQISIK